MISVVAALGGLLFGYDTAVISGAIGYMRDHFQLDSIQTGWAVSCVLIGCIFGAGSAGALSDAMGRKKVLMLSAMLFTLSAAGAAIPQSLAQFIAARILGGFAIGAASIVSPLYISEISPARMRGRLVAVNQLAIVSGMLVVYFVNARIAAFSTEAWNQTTGWRWMFGSGTLPALVFFALIFLVPESPRWLSKKGRNEEALAILTRVGGESHARAELKEIAAALSQEGGSIFDLLKPGIRAALFLGIALAILDQITGINAVIYYAPEIFKSAGLRTTAAINATVLVGLVNLVFTIVSMYLVDKIGRKPLLVFTAAGMAVFLFFLGAAFHYNKTEGPWVLLSVLGYVASFAVAMGPVVWVVIAEIYPTKVRGTAMGIATVVLWFSDFLVSEFFPYMLEKLKGDVFFVYAIVCVVAFFVFIIFVPETKNKTLEEIERMWQK